MSHTLVALILLGLVLPACGPAPDKEDHVPRSGRPTAEEVVAHYARMLAEMTAALDSELGPRPWGPRPGREGLDRASCSGDLITVHLPRWVTEGRYAEDPAPVLDPVLERHGFTPLGTRLGEATTIRRATDDHGGQVELLEGVATVLSVRTGCHPQTGPLGDRPLEPSSPSARAAS